MTDDELDIVGEYGKRLLTTYKFDYATSTRSSYIRFFTNKPHLIRVAIFVKTKKVRIFGNLLDEILDEFTYEGEVPFELINNKLKPIKLLKVFQS